jgi:membrane-associated protease RseP (regulator of RpoE activity)
MESLETLIRILQVVIGLGFIVFVHELGHFLVAKWNGVRCEAFSFGFGPVLLKWRPKYPWRPNDKDFKYKELLGPELLEDPDKLRWALRTKPGSRTGNRLRIVPWPVHKLQAGMVRLVTADDDAAPAMRGKGGAYTPELLDAALIDKIQQSGEREVPILDAGETEYRVSVLPLGGYVAMAGGEVEGEQEGVSDEFLSKKPGPRAAILVAGVTMNVVTGILMFIIAYAFGVQTAPAIVDDPSPLVYALNEAGDGGEWVPGPAYLAGLRAGDRIVNVQVRPKGEPAPEDDGTIDEHLTFTSLRVKVAFASPGDVVRLTVLRNVPAVPEAPGGPTTVERLNFDVEPRYDPENGFMSIGVAAPLTPEVGSLLAKRIELDAEIDEDERIMPGDKIVAVDGVPLATAFPLPDGSANPSPDNPLPRAYGHFKQLIRDASEKKKSRVELRVLRDGVSKQVSLSLYERPVRVRLGLDRTPITPILAVRPDGPAATARAAVAGDGGEWTIGDPAPLQPGDAIVGIGDDRAGSLEALLRAMQELPADRPSRFMIERAADAQTQEDGAEPAVETRFVWMTPAMDLVRGKLELEVVREPVMRAAEGTRLTILGLDPDGPAGDAEFVTIEPAGGETDVELPEGVVQRLLPGDEVILLDGTPLHHWDPVGDGTNALSSVLMAPWAAKDEPRPAASDPVRLQVRRMLAPPAGGDPIPAKLTFEIVPRAYGDDIMTLVGFSPRPASMVFTYSGLEAIEVGFSETASMTSQVFLTIRSLFAGTVDAKNIGGPVLIADASYRFTAFGIGAFIWFMAIISINLAVINLLPIPILDGGHLVFVGLEKLRGKPVPERVQQIAAYIGLLMLGALLVFVMINDISRLIG